MVLPRFSGKALFPSLHYNRFKGLIKQLAVGSVQRLRAAGLSSQRLGTGGVIGPSAKSGLEDVYRSGVLGTGIAGAGFLIGCGTGTVPGLCTASAR